MLREILGSGWWVGGGLRKVALGAVAAAALGCGGRDAPPLLGGGSGARLELQGSPVATFDPASGKTTVIVDFLVRDARGNSVAPGEGAFRRLVNGQAVDIEAVPDFQDTKLASNLRLGLVLDASYSMTTWQPPAFEPMKRAALDTQQRIRAQFSSWNSGTFASLLSWFQDQYVCTAASPTMPDAAVLDIPAPAPGSATKVFAATAQMVDQMKALYDSMPAPSPSDHFAVVVFTDGKDNYSWFDASGIPAKSIPAKDGSFTCAGAAASSLQDLVAKIQAFPQLRVHVIGLGNDIEAAELAAIAEAGRGRFVSNPDPGQVAPLFEEITNEFTTVRRDGITMPLPPGEYEYVQEVAVNGGVARIRFRFRAGDGTAAVRANTIQVE
jgi:hypothetical protein